MPMILSKPHGSISKLVPLLHTVQRLCYELRPLFIIGFLAGFKPEFPQAREEFEVRREMGGYRILDVDGLVGYVQRGEMLQLAIDVDVLVHSPPGLSRAADKPQTPQGWRIGSF